MHDIYTACMLAQLTELRRQTEARRPQPPRTEDGARRVTLRSALAAVLRRLRGAAVPAPLPGPEVTR